MSWSTRIAYEFSFELHKRFVETDILADKSVLKRKDNKRKKNKVIQPWFQRRRCLKMLTDGQTTESLVFY